MTHIEARSPTQFKETEGSHFEAVVSDEADGMHHRRRRSHCHTLHVGAKSVQHCAVAKRECRDCRQPIQSHLFPCGGKAAATAVAVASNGTFTTATNTETFGHDNGASNLLPKNRHKKTEKNLDSWRTLLSTAKITSNL